MKLYSKKDILFILCSTVVLLTLIFSAILGIVLNKISDLQQPLQVNLNQAPVSVLSDSSEITSVADSEPESNYSHDEEINIAVYEKCNEAVVNITTEILSMNWFMEPVPQEGSSGSGSIINKQGYVLTNTHVVENAYKVFIRLYDGSEYEGEVVGKDKENDLAIIKFDPKGRDLKTIGFGNSDSLKVGQKVLAIGNPFGYDRTLTTGVVSGLGRPVKSGKNLIIRGMIQTDASINPGNSGGPLLDSAGNIIGINTMIYTPSGGSVGIGFAVPVSTAVRVVPDLIKYGVVKRGWIDIVPVQLNQSIARYAKLNTDKGILVSKVAEGSTADKAGLKGGLKKYAVRYGRSIIYLGGDIITAVNNIRITSFSDYFAALEDRKPGDTVKIEVLREGESIHLEVILEERPQNIVWE